MGKVFKLKGKTKVIIDWANVYGWFGKLKWEIDPKKLYQYLKSYPEIIDIKFYFGVERGNGKSEDFQQKIKEIGYTLISKELKWVPVSLNKAHFKKFFDELTKISNTLEESNTEVAKTLRKLLEISLYRRKCDFDCEIAMDIMKNIDKFDGFILFSGDGDYVALINELIKRNKQTIVLALRGAIGKEYNSIKRGVYICNIKKLKRFVQKNSWQENLPGVINYNLAKNINLVKGG